jgi:hypothetical protein
VSLYSHGAVFGGNFEPTVGPKTRHSAEKVAQKKFQSLFFGPLCAVWAAVAKKNALCEKPIIYDVLTSFYVSWHVPFHPQNGLGNAMCTRSFLFESPLPASGAKVTPKVAPRQAQRRPKGPQGRQKTPPGHPKTIKKSTCDPTWSSTAAREAPGVPASEEIDPKII